MSEKERLQGSIDILLTLGWMTFLVNLLVLCLTLLG